MKRLTSVAYVALAAVLIAGCEWTATNEEDSWNNGVTSLNFSGTYRGAGPRGYIVSDYATSGGGSAGGNTTVIVVQNEPAGTVPGFQTQLSGQFPTDKLPLVPGSVTIVMQGAMSAGSFTDDAAGGMSGTYNLTGSPPNLPGTGTVDYETGVWTVMLGGNAFLETMNVFLSWSYTVTDDVVSEDVVPGNTGAAIYALTVQQTGNVLAMIDSLGAEYAGQFSVVSTAGGDPTGATSGEVVGSFQATGVSKSGLSVTITGTFQGTYTAPANAGESGVLSDRVITGTWVEAGGKTGSVLGVSDVAVNIVVP
jgi:hypothetical protein